MFKTIAEKIVKMINTREINAESEAVMMGVFSLTG